VNNRVRSISVSPNQASVPGVSPRCDSLPEKFAAQVKSDLGHQGFGQRRLVNAWGCGLIAPCAPKLSGVVGPMNGVNRERDRGRFIYYVAAQLWKQFDDNLHSEPVSINLGDPAEDLIDAPRDRDSLADRRRPFAGSLLQLRNLLEFTYHGLGIPSSDASLFATTVSIVPARAFKSRR